MVEIRRRDEARLTSWRVMRNGLDVLWNGVKEEPRMFALATGATFVFVIMSVLSAWVLGKVTDQVIVPAFRDGSTTPGALALAFAAIVVVALLRAAASAARRFYSPVVQHRLQATYRRRLTRKLLHLPSSWHAGKPTGQLLSNVLSDVETTWSSFAPLPLAVGFVPMLVLILASMFAADPVLAIVGIVILPALVGLTALFQRRLWPLDLSAQRLAGDVSEVAHESFDGALVVKTLGREAGETARFRAASEAIRDQRTRVGAIRGQYEALLEGLPSLGVLAILLVGTKRVESGALQPGQVVQVAYLFTLFGFPVRGLGGALGALSRTVAAWERVQTVLRAGGEMDDATQTMRVRATAHPSAARIDVCGVSLSHGPSRVLHDVTFAVEPGRTLAIVGPTGSGKSTLISVLVRLSDPCSGKVLIDQVDLRAVSREALARAVAVAPQQSFLFDDSVRENVTFGVEAEDMQVWEALRFAHADRFVRDLPAGLDARIGERGVSLSGGQRQRIVLARALIRKPRLLVLDDATSSVDPRVEAAILAGLRSSSMVSTVIVVAYRRATIALADEVVYLEEGRVVARGTHDELFARVDGYHRIVTAYGRADHGRTAATMIGALAPNDQGSHPDADAVA